MPRRKYPNLRETPTGFQAYIRLGGRLQTRRFKRDTPLAQIKDWLADQRTQFRSRHPDAGTLRADADRYLQAVRGMATYAQREKHVELWVAAFGPERTRGSITAADIRTQLETWRLATVAPATVNKRRTALMHLFHVLDGKAAVNPVRDTPRFREPDPEPRGVDTAVLEAIIDDMIPSASRARLRVLLWTGWPPATLKRVRPEHVNLEARIALMPGRQKGRGTKARPVPLLPKAVKAFKELTREDAWGDRWQVSPLNKVFKRARDRYAEAHPDDPVPLVTLYTLRHSFGTLAYRTTGDIRATQELMGHSTSTLTHRYTLAAVPLRLLAAIEAMRKG